MHARIATNWLPAVDAHAAQSSQGNAFAGFAQDRLYSKLAHSAVILITRTVRCPSVPFNPTAATAEGAWLPRAHEDQGWRCRAVAPSRQGTAPCLRLPRLPRLTATLSRPPACAFMIRTRWTRSSRDFHRSASFHCRSVVTNCAIRCRAACSSAGRVPHPERSEGWDITLPFFTPGIPSRLAAAQTRRLPARLSDQPEAVCFAPDLVRRAPASRARWPGSAHGSARRHHRGQGSGQGG